MPDIVFGLILGVILGFTGCVGVACCIVGRMQADLLAALNNSPER